MRSSNSIIHTLALTLVITLSIFLPLVSADLHTAALCVDFEGGQAVYNSAATLAMCSAYAARNTGGEQWDTCPDCVLETKGGLTFCRSTGQHLGGDEVEFYCGNNGAGAGRAS
ncbi:hypothetical protein BCR34DRAFT_477555 [Clohesyomyces aquaticus]|uniref:Cyanovirin-N domain-containing protein n=1 Tax=Clohesyomyces aquaticus TaxID=1231657 RepID=A0A1Y1ZZR2_9PLEO|nr:hypothetical protein BCR34DRAFT_477555 [Clohesyomyces aquaticus]